MHIHLRSIITQASGYMIIPFAISNAQLCDKLAGPVLGLYTHLVPCSRRICCQIQGKRDKRPYIKQGSGRQQGIMPEIARAGAIFVAPLCR